MSVGEQVCGLVSGDGVVDDLYMMLKLTLVLGGLLIDMVKVIARA